MIQQSIANLPYEEVISLFKKGMILKEEVLENIHKNFNYLSNSTYFNKIARVKKLLNKDNYYVTPDVIYVRNKNISEEDDIYVVRFINLVYKSKKIIVINDRVVFIPDNYSNIEKTFLLNQIFKVITNIKREIYLDLLEKRSKKNILIPIKKLVYKL